MYRITSDMENSTGNADFPPHLPLSPSSEGPRTQGSSPSHPLGPVGHLEVPDHPGLTGIILLEDLPVQQAHLGKGWTTAALPPQRLKVKIRPAEEGQQLFLGTDLLKKPWPRTWAEAPPG